jgi:hypothetical protein
VKKAADLLPAFFDEYAERDRKSGGARDNAAWYGRGVARLFYGWSAIAREQRIAAAVDHAKIAELERNIVLIEADHPGWIQILQTKEEGILESFRRKFPELGIAGVSFRLSRGKIHPYADEAAPPPPDEPSEKAAAAGSGDPEDLISRFSTNAAFQKLLLAMEDVKKDAL